MLLTGTPHQNGPQDMATLMSYITPELRWASKKVWEAMLGRGNSGHNSRLEDGSDKKVRRRATRYSRDFFCLID